MKVRSSCEFILWLKRLNNEKILYSFSIIILVVCICFFAKPYKTFDFSFAKPSSNKNIIVYIGIDKIGVEVDKNNLKFTIINHPDEVNGLYFSKG